VHIVLNFEINLLAKHIATIFQAERVSLKTQFLLVAKFCSKPLANCMRGCVYLCGLLRSHEEVSLN
jgi:hypothetical protein